MLHLQRPCEAPLALELFALDFRLAAHLDLRHRRDGIELNPVEHRGKQLECLALVFLLGILLRVAAQENTLTHVIHRREMLAPMLVQGTQHHFLLDVAHDLRTHARLLLLVGRFERSENLAP